MRIVVQDPSGSGLGVALGLGELGHEVRYRGPARRAEPAPGSFEQLRQRLVAHRFGAGVARDDDTGDLLVAVDTFADILGTLGRGIGTDLPMDAGDPFAHTLNPLVYPARLQRWCDLVGRAPRVAVVDLSDAAAPLEPLFEALPGATLLSREGGGAGGTWQPFPYLYNNVLLAIENLHHERDWWHPPAHRRPDVDWTFCGTVRHPRYGDHRLRALDEARQRWPHLRNRVASDVSFVDVLRLLQCTRYGLDLPGAGELCFRLHESLALGTPVLRLGPGRVQLAPGLERAVTDDPVAFTPPDAFAVRELYREHYAPRAAATALLAAVDRVTSPRGTDRAPSDPRSRSRGETTSIAAPTCRA